MTVQKMEMFPLSDSFKFDFYTIRWVLLDHEEKDFFN